mgnify:CR=1 FL=1
MRIKQNSGYAQFIKYYFKKIWGYGPIGYDGGFANRKFRIILGYLHNLTKPIFYFKKKYKQTKIKIKIMKTKNKMQDA